MQQLAVDQVSYSACSIHKCVSLKSSYVTVKLIAMMGLVSTRHLVLLRCLGSTVAFHLPLDLAQGAPLTRVSCIFINVFPSHKYMVYRAQCNVTIRECFSTINFQWFVNSFETSFNETKFLLDVSVSML